MSLTWPSPNGGNSALKKKQNSNGGRAGSGGVGSAAAKVAARRAANIAANKARAAKKTAGNGGRAGGGGVNSAAAKVAARRAKEIATAKAKERNNNPIGQTKSTAKTTALPSANITSGTNTSGANGPAGGYVKSAWQINADKAWNASVAKSKAAKVVTKPAAIKSGVDAGLASAVAKSNASILIPSTSGANGGRAGSGGVGSVAAKVSARAVKDKAAVNANRSDLYDSSSRDKFINDTSKGTDEWKANHKQQLADDKAKQNKNLSYGNETVAAKDKYNQAYWAKQVASGKSQAEIKAMQDAAGSKVYSGAGVVSKDNSRTALDTLKRVTGSDATIQNGGVTRDWERSGLLGEKVKGTFKWNDGTTVTTMANNPVLGGKFNEVTGRYDGGVRLGDYNSTTFAGAGNYTGKTAGSNDAGGSSSTGSQVAVASVKGGNDGLGGDAETVIIEAADSTTLASILDGSVDISTLTVDALTTVIDGAKTVEQIDEIINTTTDAEILKSLYKRRLKLMRLNRTRTRYAGLLDDADTKRSNLMSIG